MWAAVLAAVSAFVLLSNAVEKIIKLVQAAKAPNNKLSERVKNLEEWKKEVSKSIEANNEHMEKIDKSNRVTQVALLALLDHGIDGNNVNQMQHAKEELQNYLINQ